MVSENQDKLRPKGAIGVYIVENGKILLFLRKSKHANGTWCPPGGHIEYGETILISAQREAKEEAGIEVKDIEILGVTSDVYEAENKHYITVHAKPTSFSGKPALMEPEKFSELKWFDLSQLPVNLFPANKNFLAQNPPCLCGSGKNFRKCHGKL